MFHVKHKKGGDGDVKIILYIILLAFNMIVIICQQMRISELEEELLECKIEAIKEINKLRKED